MKQRKFLWKIYLLFAAFSVVPLIVLGFYASSLFKQSLIVNDTGILKTRTGMIKERLESGRIEPDSYNELAKKYDAISNSRITFISPEGIVLADSREEVSKMDNHADRPEFLNAVKKGFGDSRRYSYTLKADFLYAAMPVNDSAGKLVVVVRAANPLTELNREVSRADSTILLSVVLFSAVILAAGYYVIKNAVKPIEQIASGAALYAEGSYEKKIYSPNDSELKTISGSLNSMAKLLDEKLDIIGEQSNLQQAVLVSMKEGVLAVDYDENILLLNKTAEDILGITDKFAHGKTLQEVIRISEIQKFFRKVISEGNPQEAEIILQHDKDKFLQLSGTLLYDIDGNALGALVVFNDITNLKHLDTIKKDLVANVSHELKTPVTTIMGFIETLREGAIKDPKNAERFLDIIAKHIERLNMIIDDLLVLAKLEDRSDEVNLKSEHILPVLNSVIEDYEFKAKEKKIEFDINCDENLKGRINRNLMEQAIGNLVDNAVKYSDKKTKIILGAKLDGTSLVIFVKDSGFGIASEHIPRLFERFYRIDKGRSREEGGTGLGLAIVKHIVNTMNGTIEVDSTPGKGSVFSLRLPQNS